MLSLGTGLLDTFSPPSINAGLHAAMLAAQGAEGILYRLLGAPLMVAANAVGYLRLGSEWLGYLMACYGGGGLIGFALAGMLPVRGRGREALVAGGTISPSTTVVIMLLLPGAPFQVALFLAAGVLGVLVNVHLMTLLQTASPPQLQGRVQSLATTLSMGIMPVGMALAGVLFDPPEGYILPIDEPYHLPESLLASPWRRRVAVRRMPLRLRVSARQPCGRRCGQRPPRDMDDAASKR